MNQRLSTASKLMQTRFGVSGYQRMIIRVVGLKPQISLRALARILQTHKSTIEGPVEVLIAQGVIARERDPTDAKSVLLSLEAKGQTIDAFRSGTVEAKVSAAISGFSDAQLDTALEVFAAIVRELETT